MVELAPGARITVRQPNVRTRFIFTEGPKGDKGDPGDVPAARQIATGTGLTGGGDLSADRTLAVAFGTTNTTVARGNRGLPAGGTAGQALVKSTGTDYDVAWATSSGGASVPVTQVFDASGTWTKPAGAKRVRVILIGGGGNGNGGSSGGGGGALLDLTVDAVELAATVSVTVGAAQGATSITLANGALAEAAGGSGFSPGSGSARIGGVLVAFGGSGGTPAESAAAGGVSAAGGGFGGTSSTLASATSLAGGAGGRVAAATGSGAAGAGAGGRSAAGTAASPAGQDGDVKTARAGGGGYYAGASATTGVGGKYGGGGSGAASGGQGGACFITYFD